MFFWASFILQFHSVLLISLPFSSFSNIVVCICGIGSVLMYSYFHFHESIDIVYYTIKYIVLIGFTGCIEP